MKTTNVLVILLFIVLAPKVKAYSFTSDFNAGIYWASYPVSATVFGANDNEGDVLQQLTNQAIAEWEGRVGKEVWNLGGSPLINVASFGNAIRWSQSFAAETGFNPSTTLAVTVRYRLGTHFSRFEIILNGESSALRNNSANILYQVLLHELGHVIGLDHSQEKDAVMFASLQGNNSLSEDDISGASAVVDETLRRQEVGFVSELAAQEGQNESNALACGSVAFINNEPPRGGSGLGALLLGVLFAFILFRPRQILPLKAS